MTKLANLFPYYVNHLVIAVAMSLAVSFIAGIPMAWPGAAFYAVREVIQRERYGYWDWPGLLWPVVPLAAAELGLVAWGS